MALKDVNINELGAPCELYVLRRVGLDALRLRDVEADFHILPFGSLFYGDIVEWDGDDVPDYCADVVLEIKRDVHITTVLDLRKHYGIIEDAEALLVSDLTIGRGEYAPSIRVRRLAELPKPARIWRLRHAG